MSYRVKDVNKNVLAEFETQDDFLTYVSSSQASNGLIQFFEYDTDLYERISSGSFGADDALDLIRVSYQPGQVDDTDE